MSPDDHFQDLKRVISAISGKARRITVVMPFLYESRQHKRSSRESLDCALMLAAASDFTPVTFGLINVVNANRHKVRHAIDRIVMIRILFFILYPFPFLKQNHALPV